MQQIKAKDYTVFIGSGLLSSFDFSKFNASQFIIITDPVVSKLFRAKLAANKSFSSSHIETIIVSPGETSKSLATAEKVMSQLANFNADRDTILLALGGGVIGDLTGFIASIYKRGIRFVHLPTTLLAQVDSSIGSKNAINLPEGKNLIGTHYAPEVILADSLALASLPPRELKSGMAEVIKYGVIWDKSIFKFIEKHIGKADTSFYQQLIEKAVQDKVEITDKDPKEQGLRHIINYGHTIGHALEAVSNHEINHGEAVALGMQAEAFIAHKLGMLKEKDLLRQNALIRKLDIKISIPNDNQLLIATMRRDKKSKGGGLYFVMPTTIGKSHSERGNFTFNVNEAIVQEALNYLRNNI